VLTPSFFSPVQEPPHGEPPRLLMIVDTEEEFDWSAPFARENVSVTSIQELTRLQRVVSSHRLVPTYVCDYPVATTPESAELIAGWARDGACRIGAHLHPWVSPPFDEPLVPAMSFGCNLGQDLERAKIAVLSEAITDRMGVTPRVYKAGRYGFGASTASVLESLGYDVDASVIPHMDFSGEGGPSFSGFTPRPATFGARRRLLELPCTTGFIGGARRIGEPLHRVASAAPLSRLRAVGALSRSGILNKVMLSPEGNTSEEMQALTQALLGDGLRTFAITLHSSSLKPGCTCYVRDAGERDAFLGTIDRYCDYFFDSLDGKPTTAEDLFGEFVGASPAPDTH
jgi:hypothetical protein